MDKRKRYTAEQKVSILREVLEGGRSMSEVAAKYEVHPGMILKWRKQLFEGALQTFELQRPDITEKANERMTKGFETKLAEKDSVIAELAQEVLQLKKKYPGLK